MSWTPNINLIAISLLSFGGRLRQFPWACEGSVQRVQD
jgi:hypothetical protein